MTKNQNQRLVELLRGTGKELTVAQARSQMNIGNLRARVHELRKAGLNVQSRKNYRGAAAYRIPARDINGSRAAVNV
jgi:seryl-tRNA(Sec) selenium transferase